MKGMERMEKTRLAWQIQRCSADDASRRPAAMADLRQCMLRHGFSQSAQRRRFIKPTLSAWHYLEATSSEDREVDGDLAERGERLGRRGARWQRKYTCQTKTTFLSLSVALIVLHCSSCAGECGFFWQSPALYN